MKRIAVQAYWENRIKTASASELIIIAYEGAISNLEAAKTKLRNKRTVDAGALIIKAQKLIRELRNSLDLDIKDISANLFMLYRFMDQQLIAADKKKDCEIIDRVIRMLTGLKDAWVVAARSVPASQAPSADAPVFVSAYK